MLPITYLPTAITRSANNGGPGASWRKVIRSKQKRPYVPAGYHLEHYYTLVNGTHTSKQLPTYWANYVAPGYPANFFTQDASNSPGLVISPGFFDTVGKKSLVNMGSYRQAALNRASSKFNELLREKAEMWTTLHERKQAMESFSKLSKHLNGWQDILWKVSHFVISPKRAAADLAKAIKQLVKNYTVGLSNTIHAFKQTASAVLEKRFRKAIVRWKEALKAGVKSIADIWLELHFGWIPIMKDVGSIISLLSDPIPDGAFSKNIRVSCEGVGLYPFSSHYASRKWIGTWKVKVGATIESVQKKLFLADSAGFTNPALVAFQLLPFSFLLDWVTNVSQYIESWTGVLGIKLGNVYTTVYGKAQMEGGWYERDSKGKVYAYAFAKSEGVYMDRTLSMPAVKFQTKEFNLGPLKAITTWALLVQQMRRFSH